jgi:large subunit ribosomal protein L22
MKAYVRSVRIAPKKANLVAKMVRGMTVPDAVEALRRTHKKGARIIELLLRSAIANASHNDKQDPQMMVVKKIVVNQGTAYRRGMPMARGRMRPYRKFLSHIELELGFPDLDDEAPAKESKKEDEKEPSQKPKNALLSAHKSKTPKETRPAQKPERAPKSSGSSLSTAA